MTAGDRRRRQAPQSENGSTFHPRPAGVVPGTAEGVGPVEVESGPVESGVARGMDEYLDGVAARLKARRIAVEATPTHIADLRPDPANRRRHTPRGIGMIVDALHAVGAARSIVIDETGEVLAGNGVVEAAAEAGITRVQVVDVDGETIVAVRRRGLSADQRRILAMYDNRVAEFAEWDPGQLAADAAAGIDLAPFFFPEELAAIHGSVATKFTPDRRASPGTPRVCPACGHTWTDR